MQAMDIVVSTDSGSIYVPIQISESNAEIIGDALYGAKGQEITLAIADEAGARIGVIGSFFDSEARSAEQEVKVHAGNYRNINPNAKNDDGSYVLTGDELREWWRLTNERLDKEDAQSECKKPATQIVHTGSELTYETFVGRYCDNHAKEALAARIAIDGNCGTEKLNDECGFPCEYEN